MFELSKGGKLPLSPVLTPAWVQLPCGAWLGGTEPATFRTVRWGAGLPFSEKKNADFIQKGWKEANKVWANLGLLCPAFHSPWLEAPFIYPHSPTPELFDWYRNNTWDLLRRYVAMKNAICPFPLPTKTRLPNCRLRTTCPAVLGVFGNGWIPNNFQWMVSDVNVVHPTLFILPQKIKQTYQPTNIFHAFFASRMRTCCEINRTDIINSLPPCLPWENAWCARICPSI